MLLAVYVEFMKNRVQTFSSNQSVNQPAGLCFKVEKDKILFTAKHCDDVWSFLYLPSNPSAAQVEIHTAHVVPTKKKNKLTKKDHEARKAALEQLKQSLPMMALTSFVTNSSKSPT